MNYTEILATLEPLEFEILELEPWTLASFESDFRDSDLLTVNELMSLFLSLCFHQRTNVSLIESF